MRLIWLVLALLLAGQVTAAVVADDERFPLIGVLTDSAGNPAIADSFELWAAKSGNPARLIWAGPAHNLQRLGGEYRFDTWVNVLTNREGTGLYSVNFQLSRGHGRLTTANHIELQVIERPLGADLDSLRLIRKVADSLQAALDTLRALAGYVVRGRADVRQVTDLGANDRLNERLIYVRPNGSGEAPDTFVVGVEQVGPGRDPSRALITFQWLSNGAVWLDWHWSEVDPENDFAYRQPDVNRDGITDIADLSALIDWLILGVSAEPPDTTGIFNNAADSR